MPVTCLRQCVNSYRINSSAATYGKVVKQVVETFPFVVGMVNFGYQNLADSEGQGWGVVDNEGRPYHDFISGIVAANRWLDEYFVGK